MTLWTSAAAAAATGGEATGGPWVVTGVSIDTRTIAPGDLFVALKAARDGHDFVAAALENGAGAALVSHIPDGLAADAPLLLVKDVQAALEDLGRAARARMQGKVVAITGSVGKTSTKEMLRRVLGDQGTTHAAEKSYNNHWGVPLTLARMPADSAFAVIEIGMNHPGEIAPLSHMAQPDVAVVTTVAPAHLAAFENVAGIATEKAAIFGGLRSGGAAIYNGDLEVSPILAQAAKAAGQAVSFGAGAQVDHCLRDVTLHDACTVGKAAVNGEELLFKVPAPGRHYAMNAMAVMAVADALGLDMARVVTSLGQWQPGAGRGARQRIQLDVVDTRLAIELIDDAYNANPASLAAALEVLAAATPKDDLGRVSSGRRIAYLGDMKELGSDEAALHAAVADLPSMQQIDKVHCIGPLMQSLYQALPDGQKGRWSATAEEMLAGIGHDLDAGDVVMAKGSLSMGIGRIVDAIKKLGHAVPNGEDR